ncbi:hypothetical protein EV200_104275 [Pedobacter psychrotolerans]|uniref:Uncharacterized protein n=1 Tax=Pedobacter psychrotolerans TaxID=1843235 RepID=A0A4R2HC18_9SPHI|nr:hypothetical protein [Pedobacter psychrotolerans]TCO25238.1 hypothetical protein EV200_104275 [Pedobacter psychrotolerans]GGE47002.1 hypothetical protein GCM10011413_11420 [Pedobacter psychrotolerans]
MTVRQLAIFIRLQVEAKMIVFQSPKMLHQFIAKHYSTTEQDQISSKSFKNVYYANADQDIEKVIEMMVTMLALAQEKMGLPIKDKTDHTDVFSIIVDNKNQSRVAALPNPVLAKQVYARTPFIVFLSVLAQA